MEKFQTLYQLNEQQIKQLQELYKGEWWTKHRTYEEIVKMVQHTDLLVAFWNPQEEKLLAFARVLTDFVFRAFIYDVIVAESHRGLGLGRKLVETVLEQLKDVQYVELYCRENKIPFYEKFGFQRIQEPYLMRKVITKTPS